MTDRARQSGPGGGRAPSLWRVFGICVLAVAAVFAAYELVERTWLQGLSPEALHTLHLARGISAAAIAAALAATLILRQLQGTPQRESAARAKSWRLGVQRVRLRTKIVVPMVALAIVPALAIGLFAIERNAQSLRAALLQRLEFDTTAKAQAVQNFLGALQEDLLFLSRMGMLRELAAAETAGAPDRVAALRREVEREFAVFSQGRRAYYQLRYLNRAGHEVVRLNVEHGQPTIVPLHQLQDKSARYYVRAAAALPPGEVYVSPADFNVEHGEVEVPHRRVARYATVVAGPGDREHGLLVINVFADYLLSLVGPLPPGAEAWLVDERGTFVGHTGEPAQKPAASNPAELATSNSLPAAARALLREHGGQSTLETDAVFVNRAPIRLTAAAPERQWTLLVAHPRAPVEMPIRHLTVFLWVALGLVVAVAGMMGILLAHYFVQPVARLRQATREMAEGDLTRQVEVTTGDELEELARDFNTMTTKLRAAQERLAGWNTELAEEVARQTEHVQRLERGLARADTLASIGQMTAAVMHEIGNPLAAIKTKIQVAEEEGGLSPNCHAAFAEVLLEVDRLTAFLRSFSRLSRLREPRLERVSLVEVAQGVVTLVSPELRRRGVWLNVASEQDVPEIRGDPDQLRQLLINLILNAADASTAGAEILVRLQRQAMDADAPGSAVRARIVVSDRGTGIAPEHLERIWDPFFTTKPDGTGLGLAICRRIVEDHSGTIAARSEPGQGTEVSVTFPAVAAVGDEERLGTDKRPLV